MDKKTKVLVVDDSAFSRQAIKKMLSKDPAIDVIAVAVDGIDAISKTLRYRPDIITLDIEMPHMDGFSFLRWLTKECPTPVIMVSSLSNSRTVFRTLEMGAVDFITKPTRRASPEIERIEQDLLNKIHSINLNSLKRLNRNLDNLYRRKSLKTLDARETADSGVIAIGASTGGPQALQLILTSLPEGFPLPIVISQHMPREFTGALATRLDQLSYINVKEAVEGDTLEPSTALICPGGHHMQLKKSRNRVLVKLLKSYESDRYVPSVDIMMKSAADIFKNRTLGVILTGMGNDGKEGMKEIYGKGGFTVAESEKTAVVFGMPQEVIKAGFARRITPLNSIAAELKKRVLKENIK